MLWMVFALACKDETTKCNEADAYLNETIRIDENTWATQAEEDVGDGYWTSDCEDIAEEKGGVEYTAEAKAACADYVDAWETLDTCNDDCTRSEETDEYMACEDGCKASFVYDENCEQNSVGDCEAAARECAWACPGRPTWTCD